MSDRIFQVGDRVSILKEYRGNFSLYKGTIAGVRWVGDGTGNTSYWVLLDVNSESHCVPEYELILFQKYREFRDKIEDRLL